MLHIEELIETLSLNDLLRLVAKPARTVAQYPSSAPYDATRPPPAFKKAA